MTTVALGLAPGLKKFRWIPGGCSSIHVKMLQFTSHKKLSYFWIDWCFFRTQSIQIFNSPKFLGHFTTDILTLPASDIFFKWKDSIAKINPHKLVHHWCIVILSRLTFKRWFTPHVHFLGVIFYIGSKNLMNMSRCTWNTFLLNTCTNH